MLKIFFFILRVGESKVENQTHEDKIPEPDYATGIGSKEKDILESASAKLLELLEDEIREDYLFSVKKAIVDFVLKEPVDKQIKYFENSDEEESSVYEHRKELEIVPKPWHSSFIAASRFCRKNLFVTNPCMMQVLDLWHASFS
ncbi:unnamed protein product [Protopolystoma xenopodis]|uniref:Uncharacterized protein n=1 Tax=Protopolystoma xenopodis TaxID=117903 RepID=A0A3S5FFJ2_9PLAT|nr:unnamed protein product [Protopolystoma xenopodis]